jgi:CBS domain-containing protein
MVTVHDILSVKGDQVVKVSPSDTVLDAAHRMNEARIGSVVVCATDHTVVGIFTERDVLRRVVACGRDPGATPVSDVMSSPVTCCRLMTTLEECRDTMTMHRMRHLPVVEGDALRGIISIGDIIAHEVKSQQTTLEYLNGYLHGRV